MTNTAELQGTGSSAPVDWSAFRAVMRESTGAWALLTACRALYEWLDLPEAECVRRVQDALQSASVARRLMQAKAIVSARVSREFFGARGGAANETLTEADFLAPYSRQQQGTASPADLRYLQQSARLMGIAYLVTQAFPEAALPAAEPEPHLADMLALLPALEGAMHGCDTGHATPARVSALADAIDLFVAVAASWSAPAPADHAWWVGMARYALGRAALEIGDVPTAHDAFARGAQSFDMAGAVTHAADLRRRVTAIDSGVRADFDAVADGSLQALLQSPSALDHATSLAALATAALHAGDRFEYVRLLSQVALLLEGVGYPDPEHAVEQAAFGWFTTAVQCVSPEQLLAHLNDVGVLWARVMSARAIDPDRYGTPPDEQALADVEACPRAIAGVLAELSDLTAAEQAQVDAELAPWFGTPWPGSTDARASNGDAKAHSESAPGEAISSGLQQAAELDAALHALRLACNAAADRTRSDARSDAQPVAPPVELFAEATRLIAVAHALGSRLHVVQAHLVHAYVALSFAQHDVVESAVSHALRALFPVTAAQGGAHTMGALVTSHERALYLDGQLYRARMHAAQHAHDAVLAVCLPVIAQLEELRRRVSTPYQRATFLSSGVELYERAAAAALHLGRDELVLQLGEALKASGAWRDSRFALDHALEQIREDAGSHAIDHAIDHAMDDTQRAAAPRAAVGFSTVDSQYRAVNAMLARLPEGAGGELRDRRARLAMTRAIARQRVLDSAQPEHANASALHPPDPMSLRIADLQRTLHADEAALSWVGVGDDALLVCCVSATSFRTIPIRLSAAQQVALGQWVQTMLSLVEPGAAASGAQASDTDTLSMLDTLVATLAPVLLPPEARAFIDGKRRLVLSPHRLLHLFPFHAIEWPPDTPGSPMSAPGWLIGTFAVRYAPNLTSLCVPWSGCADGDVLAVAVTEFRGADLPPLANAEREAREVVQSHGERAVFSTNITRSQFMSMPLAQYRCVHLATHGSSVLSGRALDDPFASGIAFSDGMLDGWQLASLTLPAELVVVAACFSGQRAIGGRGLARLPGDDLLGLQSVLFEAGAGTVLGALWPADDESTRVMLVEFHRGYASGLAPDVALQRAMIRYLANPFRPNTRYHWAPFFLTSVARPSWSVRA